MRLKALHGVGGGSYSSAGDRKDDGAAPPEDELLREPAEPAEPAETPAERRARENAARAVRAARSTRRRARGRGRVQEALKQARIEAHKERQVCPLFVAACCLCDGRVVA